ncbi:MAG: iron ABC transporter permease [Bacteroidaceae bacterium]|nr:iron ABC transporter permease [Bacteroidaceae bacterium]
MTAQTSPIAPEVSPSFRERSGVCLLVALAVLVALLFLASLYWGSVRIPARAVTAVLLGEGVEDHPSWSFIVWQSRLPQAVTALLSGASLAGAGLLLQTAFRNALAGPSILGIDSGANLGVALVMLVAGGVVTTGDVTLGGFALVIVAALLGAMAVMLLLLFLNSLLRNDVMLLIAGIMVGYIASSLISLLNYSATEEGVHSLVMWGMGSFAGVSVARLPYFVAISLLGLTMAVLLIKPLNALLLGDHYARNLGVRITRTRTILLCTTGLLTAGSVAFCGPISFVGLAVPHIARMLLGSANHRTLLPATLLCGAALTLVCNLICTVPGESSVLPVNVVTPILGAPVVLYVILRRHELRT